MVTREEVIWAFRLMLGREPESEAVLEAARHFPDIENLRQTLLTSEEFAITNKVTWLKGYWVAAPVMNGQYLMWIDLGDRFMSFGCLLDYYEPAETQFMRTALQPGDIVVDAGANLGWFTLVASTIVGEAGRIHAFEPRPETADYLAKTIALNQLGDRVAVHRCGLSDAAGEGILGWTSDTDNPGGSTLFDVAPGPGMETRVVPLRALDGLALPRLDFIKADVEGAEMRLFRGAQRTLERCRPAILSELGPQMLQRVSGVSVSDYFAFFDQLGYRCFIIDLQRCGEEIRDYPEDWYKPLINLAFLPRGTRHEQLAEALPTLPNAAETNRANALLRSDTMVYKLTHFRQNRYNGTGECGVGNGAETMESGGNLPAALIPMGGRAGADWRRWSNDVIDAMRSGYDRLTKRSPLSPEQVATALYRGILGRDPDLGGLADKVHLLRSGPVLEQVVRNILDSPEFRSRTLGTVIPTVQLPDLTQLIPESYRQIALGDRTVTVYTARSDADIARMPQLIERYRYYDAMGVWSPVIDLDKEITAAIVRGLGAQSCFEMGCFTGPVLSLLAEAGIEIAGCEVSHTAFTFAYPNVRAAMLFGNLLDLSIDRRFDVILCMDVLEHVSPLALPQYIAKLTAMLNEDGFIYLNSPMYGTDPMFGSVFGPVLDEWVTVGDRAFWREWLCDDKGWPEHGHLVWADVAWWSRLFESHGLVRDELVEGVVHEHLAAFFEQAPARRSLFALRRPENARSAEAASRLAATLADMPNLPRSPAQRPQS